MSRDRTNHRKKRDRRSDLRRGALRTELLEDRRVLAAAIGQTEVDLWQETSPDVLDEGTDTSHVRAVDFNLFSLDRAAISSLLDDAPLRFTTPLEQQPTITIPRPDGQLSSFRFVSSPVMAPELAAQFPEIQTFAGQGVDDPAATIRFDVTPAGFHAQVLSPEGSYYVDPYYHLSDSDLYASYFAAGKFDVSDLDFIPIDTVQDDHTVDDEPGQRGDQTAARSSRVANRSGTQLRTYRTAVAATGEYTAFHGGTVLDGQAAIVTAINRVSGIYETELSIQFELVAGNSALVYTDPTTDPYTNDDSGLMLTENQANVDAVIGSFNYDLGHVFSTGGGGLANLGSVGIDPVKAEAVTGLPVPINDSFYVDFVAHEIGHQFGGNHTFNGDSGSCAGAHNPSTAMEPGSGSTIQAYAGICGDDDIQQNSDPYFHSVSFDEIIAHVDTVIPNVGRRRSTGNAVPTVDAGPNHIIPANTPFVLTAVGADADGTESLTYNWEQRDVGPQQDVSAGDNGSSPLFRSWLPTSSPTRYFPRLTDLVNNTTAIGETLPTTDRTMSFRATVRDNNIGGGGVNTDNMLITVIDTGEAFTVTTPNAADTFVGLSQQTISWNAAGTDAGPIFATDVTIRLSIDGGLTYPFVLADRVANSGTANVFLPNVDTTEGRIMVQAADSIFFDISDENFEIQAIPFEFDLGSGDVNYVEDSPPILVNPNATVGPIDPGSFESLVIDATVLGGDPGDWLSVNSTGTGPGEIFLIGASLQYEGVTIGTFNGPGESLSIRLNAAATFEAVQALLRHITFQHTTDAPTASTREIQFVFGGGTTLSQLVDVTPVNDSPVIASTSIGSLPEDTPVPTGARIGDLYPSSDFFTDPDLGASMTGIAVVGNPQVISEGTWYYSSDGTSSWRPIGSVDDAGSSLVLSVDSWLGFLPARDYFGTPEPLLVRGLDDSYNGEFSNSVTNSPIFLDLIHRAADGAASSNLGSVDVEITNVNDGPVANANRLDINLLQDEPIDQILDESLFSDIDSSPLTWSLRSASGGQFPVWLTFDPISRELVGTPLNRDIGNYQLIVKAADSEDASAEIPIFISVTNLNDPPEGLVLTSSTVAENTSNRIVGRLFGSDPDPGDQITWSVSDPRFFIRDAQLFIGTPIDFETVQSIPLMVTARDTGFPPRATTLPVTITIQDENEFFPSLQGQNLSIPDGTAAGTLLQTITAPDDDLFQTVRFELEDGDVSAFTLDELTGELRLAEQADRSVNASYRVFVRAYDNGTPQKSRTSQILIDVDRVNNFPPTIPSGQTLTFAENLAPGTVIGQVLAQDVDGDDLAYEITSSTGGSDWLAIDPSTGILRVTDQALYDFESGQAHSVTIRVTESAVPNRTAVGTVELVLTDANDPPTAAQAVNPDFPTARMGASVGALQFTDQDVTGNFVVATADPRFEIRDGLIALKPDMFFDASLAGSTTEIIVQVTDDGIVVDLPIQLNLVANAPWQNRLFNLDVDRSGNVTAFDTLQIVNRLNETGGGGPLSTPRTFLELSMPDVDTNGDGSLTPLDVLLVVNFLNADTEGEADGELVTQLAADSLQPSMSDDESLWLAAFSAIEEEAKKRRL